MKAENKMLKLSRNNVTSKNSQQPTLPGIEYDRERLENIIKHSRNENETEEENNSTKEDIKSFLDTIDKLLAKIKNYKNEVYPEDFYGNISECLLDINNTARGIQKLINDSSEKITGFIHNLVEPLNKELNSRLALSSKDRNELEFKTKRLYAQQSFVARDTNVEFQNDLMQHLQKINNLLKIKGKVSPSCYISYASPLVINEKKEYWIQPFLYVLNKHLQTAGISIEMDTDIKQGGIIFEYINKYKNGNHIIFVGSESLLEKHNNTVNDIVKSQLSNILKNDNQKFVGNRIYPLLISGTAQSSFPDIYTGYKMIRDNRDGHTAAYLELIENLILWMHSNKLDNDINKKNDYISVWREFHDLYKSKEGLSNSADKTAIDQELTNELHKKRLDHLGLDLDKYKEKLGKTIAPKPMVPIEKKVIIPPNLWNIGKEFQQPFANPHFIKRYDSWTKIIAQFKTTGKQTVIISGASGMGKSDLASYYYHNPIRPYEFRAWFNAGSREQIYFQYISLIKKIGGIPFSKEMSIEEQVQMVKEWLETQENCLLVYDNVKQTEDLIGLLPENGNHNILITSHDKVDWSKSDLSFNYNEFILDKLEEQESIELIIKITGVNKEENLDKLKILVNTLGYLPLALAQAGAYMKSRHKTIDDYLLDYKNSKLNQSYVSIIKTSINPKYEPIWVTFDMNYKALQEECPAALRTLNQASWMNSSAILNSILFNLIEKEDIKKSRIHLWGDILNNINKYLLMHVNSESDLLDIHPLIQKILRIKQTEEDRIKIYKKVSSCLNLKYDQLRYKDFLPHAERLNQHAKEIAGLVNKYNDKEAMILLSKNDCLDDIYSTLFTKDTKAPSEYLLQKEEIKEMFKDKINGRIDLSDTSSGETEQHEGNSKKKFQLKKW